jgi:hypothetical protein
MVYIYCAEIYCDDCGEEIKKDILAEHPDFNGRFDDEFNYDSDDFPKYANDDGESDHPQHCGAGSDCINAIELFGNTRIGDLIGTNLTADGIKYVKNAVRAGGLVAEYWREQFDCIDFEEVDEYDGSYGARRCAMDNGDYND